MRSSALVLAIASAACNSVTDAPTSRAEATVAPAPVPERIPTGVPHGGFISHVAVTEQGDAAVTLDNIGGLRLWPALDGSREPVPFSINGAAALAIAHAGSELLVGVLDEAGAVQLLRFSRTGVLHGRAQIPGEVAIESLVAIDGGMLVAREDQAIERYDATAALRGRIAAEAGETLGALATRHGSAGVLLLERHLEPQPPVLEEEIPDRPTRRRAATMIPRDRATAMRWIVLADQSLRWGTSIALPDKIDGGALALAPSHERIALISKDSELVVLDVTKKPVPVDGPKGGGIPPGSALGFVDNDRVVRISGSTHWWIATSAKTVKATDPWNIDTGIGDESINGDGAVGDGLVVGGTGPDLVLQDLHATKYLGWRELATGGMIAAGSHVGLETTMSHVIWLDRALQRESEIELADYGFTNRDRSWWLDPNHAVVMASGDKASLSLIDFRHREHPVALGSYTYVQRVDYDETLHELAVVDDRVIRRFTLDLEHGQASELQALDLPFQASNLIQLDPARNAGIVAIAWGYDDDGERMLTYREGTAKPGRRLKAKVRKMPSSSFVGAADDGTIYLHDGTTVYAMRDGKTVLHFPKGELAESIVSNRGGQRLVGIHGSAVTMYDPTGTVLWTQNVWGAQATLFTSDGSAILVRTSGGLIELDPATGARVTAACGFSFGVMTKTPTVNTFNTQPVCEDLGT